MKKIYTLFYLAIFISLSTRAQIPNFAWGKQLGGTSDEMSSSVTIDASGNVYTIGNFSNTADFDPGAGTFTMNSNGFIDVSLTKLDAAGNFVWAIQIGGTSNDIGKSVAVDAFGNVYFTGSFGGTVDFDPGAGVFNMTEAGSDDVFICKLNSAGNFVWAKKMGNNGPDQGISLTVNSIGTVYSTGTFNGTVDFDPGAGTFTLASNGGNDVYVSKLDAAGNFIFAKAIGGTGNDQSTGIKTDGGGNIVYTGYFSNVVDMDPGAGTFTLSTFGGGSYDAFVNKLDGSGNFTWSKQIGGIGYDAVYGLAIDAFNAVYLTGTFDNTADFDPGAGTFTLGGTTPGDVFISKLDVLGSFIWAKRIGGPGADAGWSIAVDGTGVYTGGTFGNTVDFDPGAGTFTLAVNGVFDAFVAKLDFAGNFLFARPIGSTGDDKLYGIAIDPNNNIYATGGFQSGIDVDPTTATVTLNSFGGYDAFVTKWGQCITPYAPTIVTAPSGLNVCVSGSVIITASSTGTITWYTSATGNSSVAVGNNFTTPILTITTTYYAEALTCAPSASRTPVTVTVGSQPTINVAVSNSVVCLGFSSKLTASGAATYTWTGGVTNGFNFYPSATGSYTVIGASSIGCTNTAVASITVNTGPSLSVTSTSSLLCEGETATLSVTGSSSYIWSTGDSTPDVVISPTTTTSYTVSSLGSNGCIGSTVYTQSVSACIGIKEIDLYQQEFMIYPNPANGNFNIRSTQDLDLNIVDQNGKIVKTILLNNVNDHKLSIGNMAAGIYIIINTNSNGSDHKRLVIIP